MARLADGLPGFELPLQRSRCSDAGEPLAVGDDAAAGEQQQQQREEEARSVQCECCGMAEDCTPGYIGRVRERFRGRWVCGLCAEAVSERQRREPALTVREAVESHASLCARFNSSVRLNPTLSLARSLQDIARRSSRLNGRSSAPVRAAPAACGGASRIGRVRSCQIPYVWR